MNSDYREKRKWLRTGLPVVAAIAILCLSCGSVSKKGVAKESPPVQEKTATVESKANTASPAAEPKKEELPAQAAVSKPAGLLPPTAVMPAPPEARSEKELLQEADMRSEALKEQIKRQIAAVVPGPYPETKEKKKEPPPKTAKTGEPAALKEPLATLKQKPPAPQPQAKPPQGPSKAAAPTVPEPAARTAQRNSVPVIPKREQEGFPDLELINKFNTSDGLPMNLISAIYVDETEAWVGTSGGGAARYIFAEGNWLVTASTSGLASDFVSDITKFQGKVYVGTKQGISVWDGFDWNSITEQRQVLLHNPTFAVYNNELWVAARNMRGGIVSFDGNKWTDRSSIKPGVLFNNASDFTFDGPDMWIGTTNRGVNVKKGKDWLIYSVTDGIASNFIYTMAVKGGKAYLGGCCGMSYFDGNRWTIYDVPEGMPHSTVNALSWDESNILWIGSKHGLGLFDGTEFKVFYAEDGLLADNYVTSIYLKGEDAWVGTIGGLSRLRIKR